MRKSLGINFLISPRHRVYVSVVVVILPMAGKRTGTKAKTTALFTGLDVAVAYDCVSAAGYDDFGVGYVLEGLLIGKRKCHNYNIADSLL